MLETSTERKYQNKNCDLSSLFESIQNYFNNREFEVQAKSGNSDFLVQASKHSTTRSALGGSRAITVLISGESNDLSVRVGTGEWAKNLTATAVGTLLTGGLSLVGSGATAAWRKKIEADLWTYIENAILFAEFELLKEKAEEETPIVADSGPINLNIFWRGISTAIGLFWLFFFSLVALAMLDSGTLGLFEAIFILIFACPSYWLIKWGALGQIGSSLVPVNIEK